MSAFLGPKVPLAQPPLRQLLLLLLWSCTSIITTTAKLQPAKEPIPHGAHGASNHSSSHIRGSQPAVTGTEALSPITGTDIALNQSSVSSIINGNAVKVGEFPSFAYPDSTYCGATLIWDDVLVTAAHCSEGFDGTLDGYPSPVRVRIGATRSDGSNAVETIAVDWTLPHPDYDGCDTQLRGDIMLVFLDSKSTSKPSPWNTNSARPINRQILTTIGHGETESGDLSFNLLKASLTVLDKSLCSDLYIGQNKVIFDLNFICTVARPRSACRGDSGGPLFGNGGMLLGLTSGGARDCVDPDIPNRYTRVSTYADWIQRNICHYSASPPTDGTCKSYVTPCADSGNAADNCMVAGILPGKRFHRTQPGSTTCTEQCYTFLSGSKGKSRRGWLCGGCPTKPAATDTDNCGSQDDDE